jgi:hypothetical protein
MRSPARFLSVHFVAMTHASWPLLNLLESRIARSQRELEDRTIRSPGSPRTVPQETRAGSPAGQIGGLWKKFFAGRTSHRLPLDGLA